jgi:putative redox protein
MGHIDTVNAKWLEDMVFQAGINGHQVLMDADSSFGGQDKGPRPKPFMLAALAGCTAMDVISILKKMRVVPKYFNVRVEGELTEEHPVHYKKIHVTYEFVGDGLPVDKLKRAVELSENNYCGVAHVYKQVMEVTSEITNKSDG